jgi:transcriptional regulator with XRE-family HTH domain
VALPVRRKAICMSPEVACRQAGTEFLTPRRINMANTAYPAEISDPETVTAAFLTAVQEMTGVALKLIRISRRMSQEELAAALSRELPKAAGQSYISKVETSDINVSMKRLCAFCVCLRCRPSRVFRVAEFLARNQDRAEADLLRSTQTVARRRLKTVESRSKRNGRIPRGC